MLVKVTNENTVEQWPYTIAMLKRENPNTSFTRPVSAETLQSYNIYKVGESVKPVDETGKITALAEQPIFVNGQWILEWVIRDYNERELDLHIDDQRMKRNMILSETDWWALPDSPTMTAEQTAYRQALRDISSHANWPHLEEADWPTKP